MTFTLEHLVKIRYAAGDRPDSSTGLQTQRRLFFLDGLRGVALILMVLNHTSRDWMDGSMGWGRQYLVYGSLLLPAPIFLFLVGFCLPISYQRAPETLRATIGKYVRRGLLIVGAGLLLNVVIFPEVPVWSGGVLQTIGLSVLLLGPVTPLLRYGWARHGLLALAVLLYLAFGWSVSTLARWSAAHSILAEICLRDFPPWPWVSAALIGLVLGWMFQDASQGGPLNEARYVRILAQVGVAFLLGYIAWEFWFPTTPGFGFKRDFILNRHWTPRGVTTFLIIGGGACLLAATYWLIEVRKRELRWLVILGQAALMLYFVHQFIELTLVNKTLGWRFNNWPLYCAANAVLLVLLVYLGKAWLMLKRLMRPPAAVRQFRAQRSQRA
jgi:uncharacterized membrane protein